MGDTIDFNTVMDRNGNIDTRTRLRHIYEALMEKGYNPSDQIIGFLISEDPAYITSHKNARREIMKIDRYDLMREMLASYLKLDDDTDVRVFKT